MDPLPGNNPTFSQIYIYDQEHELDNRLRAVNNLDPQILQKLQEMMREVNPYAKVYTRIGEILKDSPATDLHLVLKKTRDTVDPRRYNVPTGTDVAVVIPTDCHNTYEQHDVVVYRKSICHPSQQELIKIHWAHPMYDPLMYVLMFPYGDKGFELNTYTAKNRQNNKCTSLLYYRYRLMSRRGDTFNCIHRMGRLFQQYIVDMWAKIEGDRLHYVRGHQSKLRADLYKGLADAVEKNDGRAAGTQIGTRVILPSSFTAGPRYQHQLYQDAMAIVRRFGKPDFFITFTCNQQWPEITNALLPQQTAANRPDLVARVFKQKLHDLLQDLYSGRKPVLGNVIGLIYVVEWQKRGPPHAHILAICDAATKPRTPDDFDQCVCAEIPDKEKFPQLHEIIARTMIHGPCGLANSDSPCMEDGHCTKKFPKDFVAQTFEGDGYPHYRRRNDGRFIMKNGIPVDNRWVVPYNPYLSKKYNAHINVEICTSVKSCKYLYKYVYKGPDIFVQMCV